MILIITGYTPVFILFMQRAGARDENAELTYVNTVILQLKITEFHPLGMKSKEKG